MAQEISLHKTLSNLYIVKLFSFFEDQHFVYIILELCRRRSLMELHKRRRAITEPETRWKFYILPHNFCDTKLRYFLHVLRICHSGASSVARFPPRLLWARKYLCTDFKSQNNCIRGLHPYFFICKVGKSCVHSSIITNRNIKERQSCLCDGISSFTTLITMVHNTLI